MKTFWKRLSAVFLVLTMIFVFAGIASVEASGDNSGSAKNPVIFVHGYFDFKSGSFGKTNFGPMKDYLVGQGWPRHELYAIQYTNVIGCNINNAHELRDYVNWVRSQTGSNQVDIVAHSMGGLSSRYYIKDLGGTNHVGALVTLGSPHHGTPLAYLAPGEGGRQMQPGSSFLNNLNSNTTPGNVSYTSIYTYPDELVPWWRSQVSGWNNIGGWYNMHLTMLFHSTAQWHVANNLTQ